MAFVVPEDPDEKRKMLQQLFDNPNLLPPTLLSFLNDYNALNQPPVPASSIMGIAGFLERLDANTTKIEVKNTVVETAVYTYDVPGGTLQTKGAIRAEMFCRWLQNSGSSPTIRFRAKYGATTMWDATSFTKSSDSDTMGVYISMVLSANAATDAQWLSGLLIVGDPTGTSASTGYGNVSANGAPIP